MFIWRCGECMLETNSSLYVHESDNNKDRHAMVVYCDEDPGVIVGHLPCEISKISHYFTRHNGKITGEVTGHRKCSEEAGGMEVPCRLKFTGSSRNIDKLKQVLRELNSPAMRIITST